MNSAVWRLVLASAAVVLVIAGCGGSVTKADVIARADAICTGTLRSIRAVAPPAGSSTADVARYFERVLPIVAGEAAHVSKLPRPAPSRDVLNQWISSMRLEAAQYRALATGAQLGDRPAIATALGALRRNPATGLAGRYGLRECAAAGGTSVAP
jgi:hypothetical protein